MAMIAAIAMTELAGPLNKRKQPQQLQDPPVQANPTKKPKTETSSLESRNPSPTNLTYSRRPYEIIRRDTPNNSKYALLTSGLPRSLSFRKICSKCGKTRSAHGDLGYGNKCIFDTCGKCGAKQALHTRHMGIACTLTVPEGAVPGAAQAYEQKLSELALAADLTRSLKQI